MPRCGTALVVLDFLMTLPRVSEAKSHEMAQKCIDNANLCDDRSEREHDPEFQRIHWEAASCWRELARQWLEAGG